MITELTIEHLAPYLPYGLKVVNIHSGYECELKNLSMPTAIKEHYKPLLHPLSRLTQPIKVEGYNDGKEFVPMLELFKSLDDSDIVDYNGQLEEYDMKIYDELNHCISFDDDDDRIEFCCTGHSFWLFIDSDGVQNILDQYSLFQLLYKWHFDVFGLIPSGLAKELEI